MNRFLAWTFLVAALIAVPCSCGQTAADPNEGSKVEWDDTNEILRFKWWGKQGHTYFIQHSENLTEPWQWVPVIESGDDSTCEWGFTTTGSRSFLRLRHTDIATTDPELADFDGDGIGNLDELLQGTDPLSAADLDGNGLPDDWEIYYFGETGQSPGADPDGDGLTNLEEFLADTDPTKADTDGDGVVDGTLRLNFEYDLVGRLEGAREGGGATEGFGYDAGGNIESGSGLGAGNP